ncbi:MAG: FAD-binding oxidoreductase [Rhizobiaceae bacterium]
MTDQLCNDLLKALGPKGLVRGADVEPFLTDMQGFHRGKAEILVRPDTTDAVADVVRICAQHGVAIVPQGGNTGLCGGAVPAAKDNAVILSLARMNRILSVDPHCYTVTVEAGVVLQAIHDAANEVDRAFSLDWGARGSAMIGGAISTNGGGLNVLRFGTTREQVLGLEVVLPDGRIWNGLRALRKDASGYDLKQLFIGGEGTLGIITKACLKLHVLQPVDQSMLAEVADFSRLNDLFALARDTGGDGLSAFELLPGEGIRRVPQVKPAISLPMDTQADWCILARFSGQDADTVEGRLMEFYQRGLDGGLLMEAIISQSIAQEENLWHLRDEIPPEGLFEGKPIKWDVSVPIDRVVDFIEQARQLVLDSHNDAIFYAFGHIGDGNIHTIAFPGGNDGESGQSARSTLYEKMDRLVWSFGGSICAEHGVGTENVNRLVDQKPAIEMEMMREIKRLFDPEGRMNPGKLISM